MKNRGFGHYLRDTRKKFSLSLRKLANLTDLDPAYLSRVEREMSPAPRREIVAKLADALCQCAELSPAEKGRLRRELLDLSGHLSNEDELIDDLSHRFADRLRDMNIPESYVLEAVKKVPLDEMRKVMLDGEPLKVKMADEVTHEELDACSSVGEEVIALQPEDSLTSHNSPSDYIKQHYGEFNSDKSQVKPRERFRAGLSAYIEVEGKLSSSQQEQLRSIAMLIRSILEE